MSVLMTEKCNSLSPVANIAYSCLAIMYRYCIFICFLYVIVLTKFTRNKDIHLFDNLEFYSEYDVFPFI